MTAYELFTATTTNLFIEHIKTKAEAYGWTIDYYASGRLHLHSAAGAHFELYYSDSYSVGIRGCTGYDSGAGATAQPGVSWECKITANQAHFIAIGPHAIYIKVFSAGYAQNMQFGSVVDKIGAWTGGICISSTMAYVGGYGYVLWAAPYLQWNSQVLINGSWTSLRTTDDGVVTGVCAGSLYGRMPFAYSGGILPCPIMLVRNAPRVPIGYAPDARLFSGGSVYASLEEIVIDGDKWVAINQMESGITFTSTPDLLIRLAA